MPAFIPEESATGIAKLQRCLRWGNPSCDQIQYSIIKLKKRKIKFAAIFFLCRLAFLVILVDGILKFQTLVDLFGSYALVEVTLWLLVLLPTVAVYLFTKE